MIAHKLVIPFVLCALMTCSAAAAEQVGKSVPNLLGKWTVESKDIFVEGVKHFKGVLEITSQEGPLFSGTWSWKISDGSPVATSGGSENARVTQAEERIVGVVGFDGKTVHIAEKDDWGKHTGRLVGTDTMHVIYVESGPGASAGRRILKRER
jgi:hypothetical protein